MDLMVVPLYDRVLLRRIDPPPPKEARIIVPETVKQKSQRCHVIAVGPGRQKEDGTFIPLAVQPGDFVLLGQHSGSEFELNEQRFVVCREDEILCRLVQVAVEGEDEQQQQPAN